MTATKMPPRRLGRVGGDNNIEDEGFAKMKTSLDVEGLVAPPQPMSAAANEEFVATPAQRSTGWDPFEVWRTRVKVALHDPNAKAALT
jgi:hypothetical protein